MSIKGIISAYIRAAKKNDVEAATRESERYEGKIATSEGEIHHSENTINLITPRMQDALKNAEQYQHFAGQIQDYNPELAQKYYVKMNKYLGTAEEIRNKIEKHQKHIYKHTGRIGNWSNKLKKLSKRLGRGYVLSEIDADHGLHRNYTPAQKELLRYLTTKLKLCDIVRGQTEKDRLSRFTQKTSALDKTEQFGWEDASKALAEWYNALVNKYNELHPEESPLQTYTPDSGPSEAAGMDVYKIITKYYKNEQTEGALSQAMKQTSEFKKFAVNKTQELLEKLINSYGPMLKKQGILTADQ